MFRRSALIGIVLVFSGIAAMPTAAYSAALKRQPIRCLAEMTECATLVIYVYEDGSLHPIAVTVAKLGPRGEVLEHIITRKHRVHVAPGHYVLAVAASARRIEDLVREDPSTKALKKAVVSAGQTQEVTFEIKTEMRLQPAHKRAVAII